MKTTQLTVALIAASAAAQTMPTFGTLGDLTPTFDSDFAMRQSFLSYTSRWGKSYRSTEEWEARLELFKSKDAFIRNFKSSKMTVKHNQFSDWTDAEFAALLPPMKSSQERAAPASKSAAVDRSRNLQSSLTGCKTDDGNGNCTKCWNWSWDWRDDGQCHCDNNQVSNNGKVCVQCRDGWEWDSTRNKCYKCPHFCSECSEKGCCTECDPGFFLKEKRNGKADCRCNYDIIDGVCQDPDYLDSLEDDEDVVPPTDEDDEEGPNDPDDVCPDG